MNRSFEKRAISNTIANTILFILSLVQSILLVPFFLGNWGKEKYGTWILIYSLFTLLKTFDAGHLTFIGNKYTHLFNLDRNEAKETFSGAIKIAVLMSLTEGFLFFILFITGGLNILISSNQIYNYDSVIILSGLLFVWILNGAYLSVFLRIIIAYGLYARSTYYGIITKLIEISILLSATLFNFSLIRTGLILASSSLIIGLFLLKDIKKYIPKDQMPNILEGKLIYGFRNFIKSTVLTINNLFEQLSLNGLNLIIGSLLSIVIVPVFTTMRTLSNSIIQASNILLGPLAPEMIRFNANKEFIKLEGIFKANWLITGTLLNSILVLFIFILQPIYMWWTKGILNFEKEIFYLILLSVAVANYYKAHYLYLLSINHLKGLTIITIVKNSLILITIIALIQSYGLIASAVALLIGEAIAGIIVMYFTNKVIRALNFFMDLRTQFILFIPIVILSILYILDSYNLCSKYFLVIIGLSINLSIGLYLYRHINDDLKTRLMYILKIK